MSSIDLQLGDSRLRLTCRNLRIEPRSIYPVLTFDLELVHSTTSTAPNRVLRLTTPHGQVMMRTKQYVYLISDLTFQPNFIIIGTGSTQTIQSRLQLDFYGLAQMERLRENGDLNLILSFSFLADFEDSPGKSTLVHSPQIEFRISKSDWVENILQVSGLKDVALVEIPKLSSPFAKITPHIEAAWNDQSTGRYDNVLTDCRKTLESLKEGLLSSGFKDETTETTQTLIDWAKISGSPKTGEILSAIFQKTWGFVAPGAHSGKAINKRDADFAVLVTYALTNYGIASTET